MVLPVAGSTEENPTFITTLEDSTGRKIGLQICNADGKDNPLAISQAPYPRTSTQISTTGPKYSDFNRPYMPVAQDSTQGGRGADSFEDDAARFFDSYRLSTEFLHQVTLEGQNRYGHGNKYIYEHQPGNVSWSSLYGTTLCIARKFTTTTIDALANVTIWVRKIGSPAQLHAQFYDDAADAPNAGVGAGDVYPAADVEANVAQEIVIDPTLVPVAATPYWLAVYSLGGDAANHWEIGVEAGTGHIATVTSPDALVWTDATFELYARIAQTIKMSGKFFEYKRATYFLTQPDDGSASKVYINGDRGSADSNVADLSFLDDATKAAVWVNDEWIGCYVLVTKGPGSEEKQPWRRIIDNTTTTLEVDTDWKIAHTTATEYVILGSEDWNLKLTLTNYAYDVTVSGEFMVFSYGAANPIQAFIEHNSTAGVWTINNVISVPYATHLQGIFDPTQGNLLWGALNDHAVHGVSVWKLKIPNLYGASGYGYHDLGTLVETNTPWDARVLSSITQSLDHGNTKISVTNAATTGLMAVENLAQPTDITKANYVSMEIYSDIACAAGDLKISLSDIFDLTAKWVPDYVLHYDKEERPVVVHYQKKVAGTTLEYHQVFNMSDEKTATETYINWLSTDGAAIYIGNPTQFNSIRVKIGATVNAVASVITAKYFDGHSWKNLVLTDTTINPAGTTLGQSGFITFTIPADWEPGVDDGTTIMGAWTTVAPTANWYVKLEINHDLTAGTTIAELGVKNGDTGRFLPMTKAKDGDTATSEKFTWRTADYIYIGHAELFDTITVDMGGTVNAVASVLSAQYFNGQLWATLGITDGTIAAAKTMATDGDVTFTIPWDWAKLDINQAEAYWVRLKVSVETTPDIIINEISVGKTTVVSANIPALGGATWTQVTVAISPIAHSNPDCTQIRSVAISRTTAVATQIVILSGGVKFVQSEPEYFKIGGNDQLITGLEAYGETTKTLVVFKEGSFYNETEGTFVPVPLGELELMRSETMGRAHASNDVYLYFSMGQHIERHYQHSLDDVGPDKDLGLPVGRQGTPSFLLSYPGRVYAGIDAGSSGISSLLKRRESGWHEVYRAPRGESITAGHLQTLVGNVPQRLWLCQGSDLVCVPVPSSTWNPLNDTNFRYTYEGHLVTSWVTASFLDILKLYRSFKTFSDKLAVGQPISLEYQTESDTTTWGTIGDYTTSPFQERDIATGYTVLARRTRFRLTFKTNDATKTPVLKAWVLEMLLKMPVKYSYTFNFRIADEDENLQHISDPELRAETKLAIINTWAVTPVALKWYNPFSTYEDLNKRFTVEPPGGRPIPPFVSGITERHVYQMTLLEI